MASRYQQGRDTEYMAIDSLQNDGYTAIRSAGSHKAADVIAWDAETTRFIQCKRYTARPGSFVKDLAQLNEMALPPQSTSELWVRQHGQTGWLVRLLVRTNMNGRVTGSNITELDRQINQLAKEQRRQWKQNKTAKSGSPTRGTRARTRSSSPSPTTATRAVGATAAPPSGPVPATSA